MPAPAPIRLRDVREADYAGIDAILQDYELQHRLMAYPDRDAPKEARAWMARRMVEPTSQFYIIADQNDEFCGFTQITGIHFRGRFGWFGIALRPQSQGQGIGRVALRATMARARNAHNLRKLLLEVSTANANAIGLYRSEGFRDVGLMHAHYDEGVSLRDVLIMERRLDAEPQ